MPGRLGEEILNAVKPYYENKTNVYFFFEGNDLSKPGRPKERDSVKRKRSSNFNTAIRCIFLGQTTKKCNTLVSAKKLLARHMKRPDWWLTLRVAEYLKSMHIYCLGSL